MSREVNRQTKKRPEVPDSLAELLRRMVIAVEWFRAAYPLEGKSTRKSTALSATRGDEATD